MPGRMLVRSCLQSLLKLLNSVLGLAGMAFILYALWMIRLWFIHTAHAHAPPWFLIAFLVLGVFFCFITCSGHIAAETLNAHCLSCDFPPDPTGKFDELKSFVRSNAEICEWVSLSVVAAQAMSIILSMVLRALGPHPGSYYDSDDDLVPTRLPLLRNQSQHTTYSIDPNLSRQGGSWTIRINDKVNK